VGQDLSQANFEKLHLMKLQISSQSVAAADEDAFELLKATAEGFLKLSTSSNILANATIIRHTVQLCKIRN
jgi:hypothetical protein